MLPIFVINLDSSPKRLENVQAQLEKFALEFERVSAVDGRKYTSEELNKHYSASLNAKTYYKELTAGEIGCYLSHRKVWQLMVDRNLAHAVVLEDDFIVHRGSAELEALVHSDIAFDYVKLSDHPSRPRKTKAVETIGDATLVSFNKIPARTCAQLISLEGAKKLLKHSEQFGRPVDIDLQYWWEKELRVFGLQPFMFSPAPDVPSDISAVKNRSDVKKKRFKRLRQQLMFKIRNRFYSSSKG